MKKKDAVAIVTYSRDRYFELVFSSIVNQRINGTCIFDLYDVYVFQDGLSGNADSDTSRAHSAIAKLVTEKKDSLDYIAQPRNLGIAMHFDFIERFLFEERGHDYAFFFEDDLLIAPGHMQTLDLLRKKFRHDQRVGMLAANSTGAFQPISVQMENRTRYVSMDHNWAFGLSREFWRRRQPFVDLYLNFVRNIQYKDRPTKEIIEWLEGYGLHGRASSQDYIKQCATLLVGGVRIATFPNYGLYIGRQGVHCTPELFSKMGFSTSQVCPDPLEEAAELTDETYSKMLNEQSKIYLKDPSRFKSKNLAIV
ncbi:hypothetical protein D9X30_3972 [Cupriavidus sp. U2]|uniref:hypothetical protein n=1 Tax=Cupriavidus sp. U2 TaxID=2920269 RepID=UPI00129EEF27|nr:hypothetical protein [Cupriavidus sp. U2]KAI3590487.1 hypothetical protein D9X30_3972 [Cupriavidus sp. U2]